MTSHMERTKTLSIDTIKGLEVSFGDFKARVCDSLDVEVSSDKGWMMRYPAHVPAWYVLIEWMTTWNDADSRLGMQIFIRDVVFFNSMRLHEIDTAFLEDYLAAHNALSERVGAKGKEDGDGEGKN